MYSKAVLKRMLRVQHPLLQLQLLKLLKSQVTFCGKKWRQCALCIILRAFLSLALIVVDLANMKVITSIYLNCRPDLRDEWLQGTEAEDAVEALVRTSFIIVPSEISDDM